MKKELLKLNELSKKYNVKTLACLCSCNCYRIGPSAGVFSNYYHAGSR